MGIVWQDLSLSRQFILFIKELLNVFFNFSIRYIKNQFNKPTHLLAVNDLRMDSFSEWHWGLIIGPHNEKYAEKISTLKR